MTANIALDIAYLRSWIGREVVLVDEVSQDLARKYHATLDLPGDAPGPGGSVPSLIHFCLAQPIAPTSGLGEDGHPQRGGFHPPVPLSRRMWAGGKMTFHGDLKVGDVVDRVSRIEDVTLKEGRSGALCFVTASHRLEVAGELRVKEQQNIVYRAADNKQPSAKAAPAAEAGTWQKSVRANAPLLFRYSALTFNGHRIHYDRAYATEVEHYPGLVVHGPLQAALLLGYATALKGIAPDTLAFRGQSPLFDCDDFTLNAAMTDDGAMRLWTAKAGGPLCMSAEVRWR